MSGPPPKKTIEELLRQLSLGQELTESQTKEMKEYKFWKTQPVTKLDEEVSYEGPIDVPKTAEDIPAEPLPMLKEFEWVTMDISSKDETQDIYELLHDNYVEDNDATLRFDYGPDFLAWGLKPPGWKKEWHVGVRVKETGKLVAFISAIPANLEVREKHIKSVEINFLCIHKKLRNKRLAPVLIKEITRRVNRHNIWQALYTGGVLLPSPVSVCRYTHRPLNWSKLYDVGFSHLPQNVTKAQMVAKYALPSVTKTKGLRKMKADDIEEVFTLFNLFQERFEIRQSFTLEEFKHWILGAEEGEESKVIKSYVVEDIAGKITDFFSFYLLPFTVFGNADHDHLGIAYLFYYATDAGLKDGAEDYDRFSEANTKELRTRLSSLVNDALILSKEFKVDVFNALTSQENPLFLKDCKFGAGDGFLNYYLFNYKSFPIGGGITKDTKEWDADKRSGVGVVML